MAGLPAGASLRRVERAALQAQLKAHRGSRAELARKLGISERSLYRKLRDIDQGSGTCRTRRTSHAVAVPVAASRCTSGRGATTDRSWIVSSDTAWKWVR